MFETTYVAASVKTLLTYVYVIDPAFHPEMELMTTQDFKSAIAGIKQGEEIFTVFGPEDEDLYNAIHEEFHISKVFSKVS